MSRDSVGRSEEEETRVETKRFVNPRVLVFVFVKLELKIITTCINYTSYLWALSMGRT